MGLFHPAHIREPLLICLFDVLLVLFRLRVWRFKFIRKADLALSNLHLQLLDFLINDIEVRSERFFGFSGR